MVLCRNAQTLPVRIVAYKKHKRPDQFNYWITGLQSVLKNHADVRVSHVEWSNTSQMFHISLAVPTDSADGEQLQMGHTTAVSASNAVDASSVMRVVSDLTMASPIIANAAMAGALPALSALPTGLNLLAAQSAPAGSMVQGTAGSISQGLAGMLGSSYGALANLTSFGTLSMNANGVLTMTGLPGGTSPTYAVAAPQGWGLVQSLEAVTEPGSVAVGGMSAPLILPQHLLAQLPIATSRIQHPAMPAAGSQNVPGQTATDAG